MVLQYLTSTSNIPLWQSNPPPPHPPPPPPSPPPHPSYRPCFIAMHSWCYSSNTSTWPLGASSIITEDHIRDSKSIFYIRPHSSQHNITVGNTCILDDLLIQFKTFSRYRHCKIWGQSYSFCCLHPGLNDSGWNRCIIHRSSYDADHGRFMPLVP